MKSRFISAVLVGILPVFLSACGSSPGQEDSSVSGSVGGLVGGSAAASSGGSSSAFLEPSHQKRLFNPLESLIANAFAAVACPTIVSGGANCSVAGSTATLTYSGCSFPGSAASWNGSQSVAFTGATPTCGAAFPTTMTQIVRTFGGTTTRTSPNGTIVSIDTSGSVTTPSGSTYSGGITISFNGSGTRTGISISGLDMVATGKFSHVITTSAGAGGSALTVSGGNTITSGTVITFHNLAKVQGSSTFNNVGFSSTCCHPVSGTITTVFSAIGGVTPAKSGFVGATESITYNGCGNATYSGPEGYKGNITLGHCI